MQSLTAIDLWGSLDYSNKGYIQMRHCHLSTSMTALYSGSEYKQSWKTLMMPRKQTKMQIFGKSPLNTVKDCRMPQIPMQIHNTSRPLCAIIYKCKACTCQTDSAVIN